MPYLYGLPISLPIADKMEIGPRSYEEIEWLLEHGEIRSDLLWQYHKILRPIPGVYQLWKGKNQDDPEQSTEEELVKTVSSLQEGIATPNFIQCWYWLADHSYDWFPQMREQRNMPFLKKYLTVQCGNERGVIAGVDGGYILVYIPGSDHLTRFHPTWNMIYYDDEGNVLAQYYRDKKEEKPS